MRRWGVTKGKKVGIVGLGGLGHMGVKIAHALGGHVVVFTTSPSKKDDALQAFHTYVRTVPNANDTPIIRKRIDRLIRKEAPWEPLEKRSSGSLWG